MGVESRLGTVNGDHIGGVVHISGVSIIERLQYMIDKRKQFWDRKKVYTIVRVSTLQGCPLP